MENQIILTPYVLDQLDSAMIRFAPEGWQFNTANLPDGNKQTRMAALFRPLADTVARTIGDGLRPICVNGCCCAAIGVLAGLQKASLNPTLLWLDAHGDFNTWATTPSGFIGGMPLAMIVGKGDQSIIEGVGLRPLPEDRVILCDARDLDPGEKELVHYSKMHHVPSVAALLNLRWPEGPIHVHFDTDILRPEDAPAMNYLARGGPAVEELRTLFRNLAHTGQVSSVSMTMWTLSKDQDKRTEWLCMDLFYELLH